MPAWSKLFLFSKLFRADRSDTRLNDDYKCSGDFNCRIIMLDDTTLAFNLKPNTKGLALLNKVFDHLNLVEKEYFGLRYVDNVHQTHWLEPAKSIGSQLKVLGSSVPTLYFGVKFYAAEPTKLREEVTRYQFFLQGKKDILQGRLPVAVETAAELAALSVQSEIGDYDPRRHLPNYISEFRFIPQQTVNFEDRAAQFHAHFSGILPAAAESKYLEKIKWLELYGVDFHQVQGENGVDYFLGLSPTGIVVYKSKNKVGNYFWPRISKISFKGTTYCVRVRDKNNMDNAYTFELMTKQACKHLWKCSVEHHAFFRLTTSREQQQRVENKKLFNFGSKHRYSMRSQKKALTDASNRPQPRVVRTPSKRYVPRPMDQGQGRATVDQENKTPRNLARDERKAPDSPRSTKSAPHHAYSRKGGLYTSGRDSPNSVRSEKIMFPRQRRAESGSESERNHHRRRHHRESDTESEASHRRHRHRKHERQEGRTARRNREQSAESLRTEPAAGGARNSQYSATYDGFTGYHDYRSQTESLTSIATAPVNMQTAAEQAAAARRRRRRSRSPGNKPPEELAMHFRYVDPTELTDEQKQLFIDIPYTSVQGNNNPIGSRSRHAAFNHVKHKSREEVKENIASTPDEPPPPYTESAAHNGRPSSAVTSYRARGSSMTSISAHPDQRKYSYSGDRNSLLNTKPDHHLQTTAVPPSLKTTHIANTSPEDNTLVGRPSDGGLLQIDKRRSREVLAAKYAHENAARVYVRSDGEFHNFQDDVSAAKRRNDVNHASSAYYPNHVSQKQSPKGQYQYSQVMEPSVQYKPQNGYLPLHTNQGHHFEERRAITGKNREMLPNYRQRQSQSMNIRGDILAQHGREDSGFDQENSMSSMNRSSPALTIADLQSSPNPRPSVQQAATGYHLPNMSQLNNAHQVSPPEAFSYKVTSRPVFVQQATSEAVPSLTCHTDEENNNKQVTVESVAMAFNKRTVADDQLAKVPKKKPHSARKLTYQNQFQDYYHQPGHIEGQINEHNRNGGKMITEI